MNFSRALEEGEEYVSNKSKSITTGTIQLFLFLKHIGLSFIRGHGKTLDFSKRYPIEIQRKFQKKHLYDQTVVGCPLPTQKPQKTQFLEFRRLRYAVQVNYSSNFVVYAQL